MVAPLIAELIHHPQHQFWPDSLSLLVSLDRRLGVVGVLGGREALWLING